MMMYVHEFEVLWIVVVTKGMCSNLPNPLSSLSGHPGERMYPFELDAPSPRHTPSRSRIRMHIEGFSPFVMSCDASA